MGGFEEGEPPACLERTQAGEKQTAEQPAQNAHRRGGRPDAKISSTADRRDAVARQGARPPSHAISAADQSSKVRILVAMRQHFLHFR
jgi:hypothetical protein